MKKLFLLFAAFFFAVCIFSCSNSAGGGGDAPAVTTPTDNPTTPSGGDSPTEILQTEWNVTYVITNGSDDMTGESRSSGRYTPQSELTAPKKEGFEFKGWYSDQAQTQAVTSFAALNGDISLYGHWAGTLYTVKLEGIDGATLAEGSVAVTGFSAEDTTLVLPAYTKRFYTFDGLYLDSEFSGTAVTQIDKNSAAAGATLTLYAKWTLIEYNVTYIITNGSANMSVELRTGGKYSGQSELTVPQKEGFQFKGWYLDAEQTQAVTSFAELTGDLILYGHWAGTLYTVVIEGIDGAALVKGSLAVTGFSAEDTTLSLPSYTKRFYDFAGLFLDSDYNGTAVTQIDKSSAAAGATLTLYAKWTEKVYTVNYDLLFDSGVTNPNTITTVTRSNSSQTLTAPTCADENYIFDKWCVYYNEELVSVSIDWAIQYAEAMGQDTINFCATWLRVTPNSPNGAHVRKTSMQAFSDNIEKIVSKAQGDEYYLIVTDKRVEGQQLGFVNGALKAHRNSAVGNYYDTFYFDFSASTESFDLGDAQGNSPCAFDGCKNVTGVIFPANSKMTKIPDYAFNNCLELRTVNIPSGVVSIGAAAFAGCKLENINIPSGVVSIGTAAFAGCKLENINIPNGVTSIGKRAFDGCSVLVKIVIPDSVTTIGEGAFRECQNLEEMTIPFVGGSANASAASRTTVFGYIFGSGGTNALQTWDVNSDITGNGYFRVPSSIKKVTVTGGKLYAGAFSGCKYLESITLPSETKSIAPYVFMNCSSLKNISIPNTVTSIGYYAFRGCSSLESVNIPSEVKSISQQLFEGCSSLKSIDIPSGVTVIYKGAFDGCSALTSIEIPTVVTDIRESAFKDCSLLANINIPSGVEKINESTFEGCSSLARIEIPNGVTEIGWSAFKDCGLLASVNIPSGVKAIKGSTFEGCSSLVRIEIPTVVTDIGWAAFKDCASLESLNIPSGVVSIGESAFKGCGSLASVNIPSGIKVIQESTFEGCASLANIQIPDDSIITEIGDLAFCGCSSLKTINLQSGVKAIFNYAFKDCVALTSITVPSLIGVSAFEGCSSLYSVITTCSKYEDGEYGHYYSGRFELRTYENDSWSLYQSSDHGIIGLRAFKGCSSLRNIVIPWEVYEVCPYAFEGTGLTSAIVDGGLDLVDDNYRRVKANGQYVCIWDYPDYNAKALAKDYVGMRFVKYDLSK